MIPDEWKTTGGDNPRTYLVYDNGPDSISHTLVFTADAALHHLARSRTRMMDGTFDTALNIFAQLCVKSDSYLSLCNVYFLWSLSLGPL